MAHRIKYLSGKQQDEIHRHISSILVENERLLRDGNIYKYQMNCNYLKGIRFVYRNYGKLEISA